MCARYLLTALRVFYFPGEYGLVYGSARASGYVEIAMLRVFILSTTWRERWAMQVCERAEDARRVQCSCVSSRLSWLRANYWSSDRIA